MNIILSQYALTNKEREDVVISITGDVEFLVVSNLVHNGYWSLIQDLTKIRCNFLYIYVENSERKTMLPILSLIATLIKAETRSVISSEGTTKAFSLLDIFANVFILTLSFSISLMAICACYIYAIAVEKKQRVLPKARINAENIKLIFLRPMLWSGLQAGGAFSHGRGVIEGFLELGHYVYVLADSVFSKIPNHADKFMEIKPTLAYVVPRELNYFKLQWTVFSLVKRRIGQTFDGVIYLRFGVGALIGVFLSRYWRVPLIVEFNGSEIWLAKNWGSSFFFEKIINTVEKVVLRHAHVVIAVSKPLESWLLAHGIAPERILVSPNGVNTSQFSPNALSEEDRISKRKEFGLDDDSIVFTFVGTFGVWHGVSLLAETIASLYRDAMEGKDPLLMKMRFIFVGSGVEYAAVENILHEAIENGYAVMTGLVSYDDVPAILEISDALLMPTLENPDGSEFFGSPTKLFEYMASGRPIIASGIGQISEILAGSPLVGALPSKDEMPKPAHCGILTKPGDAEELYAAIRFVADNPQWRSAAGAVVRQRVISRYTWRHHVESIMQHLSVVIAKERPEDIRVLINGLHSKSGGGITYLMNMLPRLAKDPRLDVHICLHHTQRSIYETVLENVTCHEFSFRLGFWRLLLQEQFNVPILARKIRADVTFSPANYGPLLVPHPVVLLRNSMAVVFVEKRLSKLLYWALLYVGSSLSMLRATRVISVSSYAKKSGAGMLGWLSNKFLIIPHGTSAIFNRDETSVRKSNELLVVSDIYVQKNLHSLLSALPSIICGHPSLILRIAGAQQDVNYTLLLKKIIHETGLGEKVIFEGSVATDRLLELYRRCTVFVFPSTVETFGNPLVEAMACGAPIACSNTAAMPEVAGDAAIYFDPHSIDDISRVILSLLDNRDLRDTLSARATFRSKFFTWEKTVEATTRVLIEASGKMVR